MSNYPMGANEDRNAPWHEKESQTETCPECNGAGCVVCDDTGVIPVPDEEPDPDMYRDER